MKSILSLLFGGFKMVGGGLASWNGWLVALIVGALVFYSTVDLGRDLERSASIKRGVKLNEQARKARAAVRDVDAASRLRRDYCRNC